MSRRPPALIRSGLLIVLVSAMTGCQLDRPLGWYRGWLDVNTTGEPAILLERVRIDGFRTEPPPRSVPVVGLTRIARDPLPEDSLSRRGDSEPVREPGLFAPRSTAATATAMAFPPQEESRRGQSWPAPAAQTPDSSSRGSTPDVASSIPTPRDGATTPSGTSTSPPTQSAPSSDSSRPAAAPVPRQDASPQQPSVQSPNAAPSRAPQEAAPPAPIPAPATGETLPPFSAERTSPAPVIQRTSFEQAMVGQPAVRPQGAWLFAR